MYVCNCNGINEKTVKSQATKSEENALSNLKKECGLGGDCGMCIQHAKNILRSCYKD